MEDKRPTSLSPVGEEVEIPFSDDTVVVTDEQKLNRQRIISEMAKSTRQLLSDRVAAAAAAGKGSVASSSAVNRGRLRTLSILSNTTKSKKMNEVDANGWAHVHHAAYRGFVKSVARFIENVPEQLELETGDALQSTPLLLACMGGSLDTVKMLVDSGAKISKLNMQRHGVVELSAFRVYVDILHYLTELGDEIIPAWNLLIKFATSDFDEEAESSAKTIRLMIDGCIEPRRSAKLQAAHANGVVPAVLKVIKGGLGDEAKCEVFRLALVLVENANVRNDLVTNDLIPSMVKIMKSNNVTLLQLICRLMTQLSKEPSHAERLVFSGAVPAVIRCIQTIEDGEALPHIIEAVGAIAAASDAQQSAVATTPGALTTLVTLLRTQKHRAALEAACYTVAKIARGNESNQAAWAAEGGLSDLLAMTKTKYVEVQTAALEAVTCVAQNNLTIQEAIIKAGAIEILMDVLTKVRHGPLKERTAMALWTLAGDNYEHKKKMAEMMGMSLLFEFVNSASENLTFIGSEAVGALMRGPRCHESMEVTASVVAPLVRLLRSNREAIVLSGLRTIRQLCVSVGYVPNPEHQDVIVHALGVKMLVALLVHCTTELIQAEAAHTLSCLVLGNAKCLEEVKANVEFSYVRIVKMMYSQDAAVRILAGAALATFAFNNPHGQQEIVEDGGVRFQSFIPFVQSDVEYYRCNAAFQIVVLAPIIPDEVSAICCAAGLKLLADLLAQSHSDDILLLTCDCIARLAHLREGIPQALGAIGVIEQLVTLMSSSANEPVRGAAAIALGFLSYNYECRRLLLQRCRADISLMPVLRKYMYTDVMALCPVFVEAWAHFDKLTHFPKIKLSSDRQATKKKFRTHHSKKTATIPDGTFLPPLNPKITTVFSSEEPVNMNNGINGNRNDVSRSADDLVSNASDVRKPRDRRRPSHLAKSDNDVISKSRISFSSDSVVEVAN